MQIDLINEARRQAQICNACRYCEGYCSVFPALHAERAFSDGNLTQLANLCHNCRGCFYACQYTAPHEFDLNLPKILAEVRNDSWADTAWPAPAAKMFQKSGSLIALSLVVGFALLILAIRAIGTSHGEGFYAVLSHNAMVAMFLPAFVFPLVSLAVGLPRYWRVVGGQRIQMRDIRGAVTKVAQMKDLAAGHGDGCNFEDSDRFSHARRYAHQLIMYGFLMCFASTGSATLLHYLFDLPAPYAFWSLPKLLGVPGGLMLSVGGIWMVWLKLRADASLSDAKVWGGEMGFVLLLTFVAISGLALYWAGSSAALPILLAVHLGAVLTFFLLTPFTKMAHGFYRMAALIRDAQRQR